MTDAAPRSSIALPVLLAVIGVAALATAVMLVPVIIRTSLAQVQTTLAQPLAAPVSPAPGPAATPVLPLSSAVREDPGGGDTAADTAPDAATGEQLKWTLALDTKSYALDDASAGVVDRIVSRMRERPKATLALTGVNNPMRSSKRAKEAARRVKELLIEAGVERYRVTSDGAQEEGATGLVVRVEIVEGER